MSTDWFTVSSYPAFDSGDPRTQDTSAQYQHSTKNGNLRRILLNRRLCHPRGDCNGSKARIQLISLSADKSYSVSFLRVAASANVYKNEDGIMSDTKEEVSTLQREKVDETDQSRRQLPDRAQRNLGSNSPASITTGLISRQTKAGSAALRKSCAISATYGLTGMTSAS